MQRLAKFLVDTAMQISGVTNLRGALVLMVAAAALSVWSWGMKREGKNGVEPGHFILAGIAGVFFFSSLAIAGLVWQKISPNGEPQSATEHKLESSVQRTHLRLVLRENQDPQELSKDNIYRWFVFKTQAPLVPVDQKTRKPLVNNATMTHMGTYFFITFEKESSTNYRRVYSGTKPNLRFQVLDLTPKSMVVFIPEDPSGAIIDFDVSAEPL